MVTWRYVVEIVSIHASAPPSRGMEDVLANQVICAIYKLPDDLRGSDIARPPPGVVLPKKTVQLADLKGGANQWHEDGDRRRAPAKIIKIKRLGKAAHRSEYYIPQQSGVEKSPITPRECGTEETPSE